MNVLINQHSSVKELKKYDSRCFGYYANLNEAKKAVEENRCDIHETMYDFVVIEEIEAGIHADTTNNWWFKYNKKEDCYESVEVETDGVTNYAIG